MSKKTNTEYRKFDWKITAYDYYENEIDCFLIRDKTEKQAMEETLKTLPTETVEWDIEKI